MPMSRGLPRWRRDRPVLDPASNAASDPVSAPSAEAYDDRHLLDAARAGDHTAIEQLYRRHQAFAQRAARRLCDPSDVDDVVSDAFVRVLAQLRQGGGPRVSFRAYLLTAVRSAHAELVRRDARLVWTDRVEEEAAAPVTEDAGSHDHAESKTLAVAMRTLPVRWQLVLWWGGVERRPLADIGRALDLNANAVAALAFRAREGLRTAYLAAHLSSVEGCRPWLDQLPRHLRGQLAPAAAGRVEAHLDTCRGCRHAAEDLLGALPALAR